MNSKWFLIRTVMILVITIGILTVQSCPCRVETQTARADTQPEPVVAIYVSELTQALETMPAVPPTPIGVGYSGYQWFYTSWHYFVMYESLKIALESDGTPYIEVTDADIAGGALQYADGSPKYPIVFSLASEAVADNEIDPLRDYVDAGGFLFVGSSAFTRNPDGTTRADFALASEMGLNLSISTLDNWALSYSFTRLTDHRLVSHIPAGTVNWDMLTSAEQIVWATTGYQQLWRTVVNDAEVIAMSSGYPLLATKGYGSGRFIYHAIFNPIVGAGGQDSGMYAYTIYRSAVEWAFEAADLPIVKRSPWPYDYDAALLVRHDFENSLGSIATIASSAQYEQSVGAKGDYYFCTGILRTLNPANQTYYINSMSSAIRDYGATIGSHNGGYPNIGVTDPSSFNYWHWGPDIIFDRDPSVFPYPYSGSPTAGYDYSLASIQISFQDLAGWFAGLDNGRAGCGAAGNCPSTWVSPSFNSGRDRSLKILSELGSVTMGEQKISPYPHRTLSYDPATPNYRYNPISLPPSDWYVGPTISQSQEAGHNSASIQALVDFYFQKGYLLNLYGHSPSTSGNMKIYLDDAIAKGPRLWKTNAVGVSDWWGKRAELVVTPSYSKSGESAIAIASISGSTDPQMAIELVLPYWSTGVIGNLEVRLNGTLADSSEFRSTNYGVKVRVGTMVTVVEVLYQPLESWTQTDWVGGAGQTTWSDASRYDSAFNIINTVTGQVNLNLSSTGNLLFSDDFNRSAPPPPTPVPFSWPIPGPPVVNNGLFNTNGGTLNTSGTTPSNGVGFAYSPFGPWNDYSVEADIKMPSGSSGGGGFSGRWNTSTGARYGIWIYPSSNLLRLIKFSTWYAWNSPNGLKTITVPGIGTGWHHIKMTFNAKRIQVFVDNSPNASIDVSDYSSPYSNGYTGVDFWTSRNILGPTYNNFVVRDLSNNVLFADNFGDDPTVPNLLTPWSVYTGSWSVPDFALRSTAGGGTGYANIYYNPSTTWTDYSIQARVQYPSGAFGGGPVGRLNSTTGTRYTAWVYAKTNTLNLLKWSNWTSWSLINSVPISPPGESWHTVKMDFAGSSIRVYWDGSLLIDAMDSGYTSGGIGFDTTSYQTTSPYLMAIDDVEVRSPAQYESSGVLTSSAFDGGEGVNWYTLAYDASVPASTSACVRTRTADQVDLLADESWSDCYSANSGDVTSPDRRWIQYQVELGTSNTAVTPIFYENYIVYTPGSYLQPSYLTYDSPTSGDDQTTVSLSATLLDETNTPIIGRTITFTLDSLPAVSGVTDGNGVATANLSLNIAPGPYPLEVTFAGDGIFRSSSNSTTFNVTESWSEWIQDSDVDFAAGTGTMIDTTSIPGSVILLSQMFGESEETGPFILGDQTWQYRHQLVINNPNTSALASGYTLKLVVDTASLVTAGKLLENGDDLRFVWTGGSQPLELDRVADTPFNNSATQLWFKSQAAIPAGSQDNQYYIYYGNLSAGAPPADPTKVFALYDGFDDNAINTVLWTKKGTVSESGGWAHLSAGGDLFGKQLFVYGLMEMRVQAAMAANYMWWGWEDGVDSAPNFVVFEQLGAPSNLAALLRSDGSAYQRLTLTSLPSGGVTLPHTYATEWRPGQARWYIDGVHVQSSNSGVPHTAMMANLNAYSVAYNVDWVRVRVLADLDPMVTLASAYTGYPSHGMLVSAPFDTGGISVWGYLTWNALTPNGTSISVDLRTATTQPALDNADWVNYTVPGTLVTNPPDRWVQYRLTLDTNDSSITPEFQHLVLSYYHVNQALTASDDIYSTDEDTTLIVDVPGVLGNDTDPENSPLTAILNVGSNHGILTLNPDGSFSYTPEADYSGEDSFTYKAYDGSEESNIATVTITITPVDEQP